MVLSKELRQIKLRMLVEAEGFSNLETLLEAAISDSVCPAICINDGCSYSCEMEPDQDQGWCEVCGTNTVHSALILAGVI